MNELDEPINMYEKLDKIDVSASPKTQMLAYNKLLVHETTMTKSQLDNLQIIIGKLLNSGDHSRAKEGNINTYALQNTLNDSMQDTIIGSDSTRSSRRSSRSSRLYAKRCTNFSSSKSDSTICSRCGKNEIWHQLIAPTKEEIEEDDNSSSSQSSDMHSISDVDKVVKKHQEEMKYNFEKEKQKEKLSRKVFNKYKKKGEELYKIGTSEQAEQIFHEPFRKADDWLHEIDGGRKELIEEQLKGKLLVSMKNDEFYSSLSFLMTSLIVMGGSFLYYGPYGSDSECLFTSENPDRRFPGICLPDDAVCIDQVGYQSVLDSYSSPFVMILLSICYLWWDGWFPFLPGNTTTSNTVMNVSSIWASIFYYIFKFIVNSVLGFLNLSGRLNRLGRCADDYWNHNQRQERYNTALKEYESSWFGTKPPPQSGEAPGFLNCMKVGTETLGNVYTTMEPPSFESKSSSTILSLIIGGFDLAVRGTFFSINQWTNIICQSFDAIVDSSQDIGTFPIVLFIISLMGAHMFYNRHKARKMIKDIKEENKKEVWKKSKPYRFNSDQVIKAVELLREDKFGPLSTPMASNKNFFEVLVQGERRQRENVKLALAATDVQTNSAKLGLAVDIEKRHRSEKKRENTNSNRIKH